MKKYIKFLVFGALAIGFFSCDDEGDEQIDALIDTVERGAILRTTQVFSNELPIGDSSAAFSIEVEEQDEQDGALLASVDVFASFSDNTPDNGDTAGANTNEFSLGSIDASEFTTGEFGLPRTTITHSLQVLTAGANVDEANLFGGDVFTIRLVLNLTDGRSFTNSDVNGNVASGSFFLSPFEYAATVTCAVEPGFAEGNYALAITSGLFPDFGATTDFTEGVYNIIQGDGDTARIIEGVPFLPEFGDFVGPINFNLICGQTLLPLQALGGGVGCGGAIQGGAFDTEAGVYNTTDDSVFTLEFLITAGDSGSTCPSAPYVSVLTLTRQ